MIVPYIQAAIRSQYEIEKKINSYICITLIFFIAMLLPLNLNQPFKRTFDFLNGLVKKFDNL